MADEDFILEDDANGSGSRRTFLILAGSLLGVFILAAACSLIFLFSNRNTTNPEATAIAATNAVILITNEAVTAAIEATNLAMVEPSDTPEATATTTLTPEPETPTPTNTAVAAAESAKETPTPNISGTTAFTTVEAEAADDEETEAETENGADAEAEADDNAAETEGDNEESEAGEDNAIIGTGTPIPAATSESTAEALPDTGFNTWGPILAALLLVGLVVAARSLRRA